MQKVQLHQQNSKCSIYCDEGGKFDINLSGQSLVITVDGATRMINFDEDSIFDSLTGTETSLVEVFQEKLNQAFGSNRVTVGFLKETVDGKEEYRLHLHAEGSTITINNYINPQETTDLGFRINQSNPCKSGLYFIGA